jgi:hypothetical protein
MSTPAVFSVVRSLYEVAIRLTREPESAGRLVQRALREQSQREDGARNGRELKLEALRHLHSVASGPSAHRPEPGSPEGARGVSGPGDVELPACLWHPLWLRDVEDLSYDEVSGVLAVPVTLVVSRIEQARQQMSERLRQDLDFAAVTARLREGRSSRHVETD